MMRNLPKTDVITSRPLFRERGEQDNTSTFGLSRRSDGPMFKALVDPRDHDSRVLSSILSQGASL